MSETETDNSNMKSDIEERYDLQECAKWIDANSLEKICLQFPDSLLTDSVNIALYLEKRVGKKIYILGDTTCDSCCVDEIAAEHVNASGIIHFGHACLNPTVRLPVFYVLPKEEFDVITFITAFQKFFDQTKKILLFYDVVYAHVIEQISNILQPKYDHLVIATLKCVSNRKLIATNSDPSINILGRSYSLENGYRIGDYEAVFLEKNEKTSMAMAMSIPSKAWYFSEGRQFHQFVPHHTRWLKRRRYLIEKLKDAEVVGIVVTTLAIKDYLTAIHTIKAMLKSMKKKTYILNVGKPNPAKLANFPEIDAFVPIACHENEIFDSREFFKPILMPYEVEMAFNSLRDTSVHHCLDFRQMLPGGLYYVGFKPSTKPDMSLISGVLRNTEDDVANEEKMGALTLNSEGTVAIGKAGAQFLNERSWKGVEQRLGEDAVSIVQTGRCGLPSHYENEPLQEKGCT